VDLRAHAADDRAVRGHDPDSLALEIALLQNRAPEESARIVAVAGRVVVVEMSRHEVGGDTLDDAVVVERARTEHVGVHSAAFEAIVRPGPATVAPEEDRTAFGLRDFLGLSEVMDPGNFLVTELLFS